MKKARYNLRILFIVFGTILLISFISEVFPSDATSSRVELKAWADKLEMGSDQDLVFTVQAVWVGKLDRFKIEPIRPPECKLFEILGSSSINETKIIEGKSRAFKTFSFVLKATQQGQGGVGSVEFRYVDPVTQDTSRLSTQPIAIQIGPPIKKEGGDGVIYLVLILVIFFTSLTYFVIRRREKERQEEKINTEEKVEMSLEQDTSEKLSALEPLLRGEKMEEFFRQIYRLITRYIQGRYHIVTTGKTTPEIMASLSHLGIEERRIMLMESVLKRCDLVKFAKEESGESVGETVLEDFRTILEQS